MAEPDDLPPLEDFSQLFSKLGTSKKPDSTLVVSDDKCIVTNLPVESTEQVKTKTNSFGGLRKGFLNSKPKKEVTQQISLITSNPSKEGASIKMDEMKKEVDRSLQEQVPMLPDNLISQGLLDKVESNPLLAQAFRHPDFSQVITRFTQNPAQAIQDYGETPAFREFFKEICALLGQHFTELADKTEGNVEKIPIEDEEDRKVREILEKEDVQEVMRDERIQQLIMDMKENPERAQNTFVTASPQLKRKIRVLTDYNIIGLQSK